MDSRQHPPGMPFSRNNAASPSQYTRSPFPPASNSSNTTPSPYPPGHQPSSASPAVPPQGPYSDHPHPQSQHQRHPSDSTAYYSQSRPSYPPDHAAHPPHHGSAHARHHSSSSIGGPLNRNMPPPSPPRTEQGAHFGGGTPHGRPPSLGPPGAFASGRELPALSSIPRSGSSMSISAMLGGPSSAHRETTPSHATHAPYPPPATSA
ncbi:hypothetical protein Micbo1qcDRAFT_167786, partial [Microdochium bolleyi]